MDAFSVRSYPGAAQGANGRRHGIGQDWLDSSPAGLIRLQKPGRNSYFGERGRSRVEFLSMAVGRPFWKGYLKLSLVSCPIAMFPASSTSERVSFRQISKKTGHRLKQQLVDAETGEVVESPTRPRSSRC